MPIIQNIARKQGRINPSPGSQTVNQGRRVFPKELYTGADVGDVLNPGNPAYLTAVGQNYSNRTSSTGGSKNPVGNFLSTATQPYYPPITVVGQVGQVLQQATPEVMPHEKGSFFPKKNLNVQPVRQSGGVSPTSDSAFHPAVNVKNRPMRFPAHAGERTSAESFGSTHTLVAGGSNMDVSGSRWSRIKRSAAEAPIPTYPVPQTAQQAVGQNGWISSRSRKPVIYQQHVGGGGFPSPYIPRSRPQTWIDQQSGVLPTSRPNTFPVKVGCQKGCK
jgi:hypothetical protein